MPTEVRAYAFLAPARPGTLWVQRRAQGTKPTPRGYPGLRRCASERLGTVSVWLKPRAGV